MKKRNWIWIVGLVASILTLYLVLSLLFHQGTRQPSVSEFSPYISGYTSGVISKSSSIKIQLSNDFAKSLAAVEERSNDLFEFDTEVSGTTGWIDFRTVQFIPEKPLESDKSYKVRFKLIELDDQLDKKYKDFEYEFHTKPQNFSIYINEIKTIDKQKLELQQVYGEIRTSDTEETENMQKIINAEIKGKNLNVDIRQKAPSLFLFVVDSVPRSKKAAQLKIEYNGDVIGVEKSGVKKVKIPSVDDFVLLDAKVVQHPEQYVKLQFSDPILENQFLDGLIQIQDAGVLVYSVQDNVVKVYPSDRLDGEHLITLNPGIKNILGSRFKKKMSKTLVFEQILPAVRMTGKGVIMPRTEGNLVLPFEAVNLKAVDIRITKIFENNVMQFLQVNDMSDNYELKRVGKVIKTKTVFLDQTEVTNLGQWNRFTLDLNELITTDPGAIYRVDIGFRKKYAIYPCENNESSAADLTSTVSSREEKEFWENFDDYYYDYGWYNWEKRNDPCHVAYYGYRRAVSRNIFASNMGVIAKEGNDGSMLVIVTDLNTAQPIKDAHVDIHNYQQQFITTSQTDKNGVAVFDSLPSEEKVSFVIASFGQDKAYLKVNDGNSLSLSDFDVDGIDVSDGLKGFVYAERGVWRPGDSIFVGFILEDIRNELPLGHPVIFELYNSRSQLIDKQVQNLNEWHFHSFRTKTDKDAPTGNYSVRITVGGKTFYKSLAIETIKPNRLKIDLQLQKNVLYANQKNKADLWIHWLHGAPAKDLNAKVSLSLYPMHTEFKGYENYHFDDITGEFNFNTTTILDANTDNKGLITESIEINTGNTAPGMLMAKLTTKAFEKGGNFSIQEMQVPYHPYPSYVGISFPESSRTYGNYLSTDKEHSVDVVTLSPEGKLVASSHDLQVELVKVDWSWWYYSYDYSSNYASSEHYDLVDKETIKTTNGKCKWAFEIDHDKWGYYLLKVTDLTSGHATSQRIYADWPEYSSVGRNQSKSANILQFKSDKEVYTVNEPVKLTLPGSEDGRAFISIENGTKVLDYFWLETESGDTEFTFNVTEKMTPNVYVHINLIQPHEKTVNDRPIRMYGVIPIKVENPETHLDPEIIMDDELLAESQIKIEVREKNKKDMTYTIAIVDEGLLALTNYSTPNPWDNFYAREALGVKTWDMYDWVIGAYGKKLERLLSIGGGGSLNKESAKNSNRFTPMVRYLGPFHLNGGQKAVHKVQLPKYIGAVRTMVIAGNDNGAYGSSEKSSSVTKPLMVLGTLPRVLGPQEEVKLPITVFAMKDNVRNVSVQVNTNDLFENTNDVGQSVIFDRNGDKTISFSLKTADKQGKGIVEIIAVSGNERATYTINIDIRNPNPLMYDSQAGVLSGKGKWEYSFNEFGISGSGETRLEIYAIPPLNLHKRVKYLINYPHGCLEQTVSAAFPQLYLENLTALTSDQKEEIQANVNNALNKLRKYQISNGGFSYWPGGTNTSFWATNYAGHFMIEAKHKGYDIPEAVFSNWQKYQKSRALKWMNDGERSQLIQAYRLYSLSLAGKPVMSAMNRLRQSEVLSEDAAWKLAAAYQLAGKKKIAEDLIRDLSVNVAPYNELSNTFGSSIRDKAMILETFVLLDMQQSAFEVLLDMSKTLGSESWLSTQTTAYSLMAAGMYIEKYGVDDAISIKYKFNNGQLQELSQKSPIVQIPLSDIKETGNTIDIENTGDAMLFVRLVREGVPKAGTEKASSNKVSMQVNYLTLDGKSMSPNEIEQGTDFVCEVKVTHQSFESQFDEMALSQIFPSGWEIINSRMFSTQLGENSWSDYQDIRDDRVYTYFSIPKSKTKTYRFMLNASYAGKFYMPAVNVEAMYDKSIHARNKGRWIEVVQPQN